MDFKMETVSACSSLDSPVGDFPKILQIKIGKSSPHFSNVAKMRVRRLLSSWYTIARRAQPISPGTLRERIYLRRPFWQTHGISQYRHMCDTTPQILQQNAGHRRRVPTRISRTYHSLRPVPSRPQSYPRLYLPKVN